MPFIGTQPEVGGYSVLDALTASATASYTLQLNSANFVPSSANQLLVSLNGVIQKPGSSFTVSGSTLTFSSTLASSDSIDFILAMGEPLLVGTPSDGTVDANKLATNAVSTAKIASSAVTDAKIASGVSATKLTTGTLPAAQVPAGTTLQTVHSSPSTSFGGTTGSVVKVLEVSLTTKAANSHFLVSTNIPVGSLSTEANNDGHDISLAIGYKLASAADSAYVDVGGNSNYNRQNFTGTAIGAGGAFYQTDVPFNPNRTDSHSGAYDVMEHGTSKIKTDASVAAGTAIKYAVYSHSQEDYYINRPRQGASNGGSMFLTVSEIKA